MRDATKHEALRRQSLARPLSALETELATALEAIFAAGTHDFAAVADALRTRGTTRPSGATEPWSDEALRQELRVINASLDAAYAADGIGA